MARHEAAFRTRLGELLDAYKALLVEGRDDAEQFTRAVAALSDEAAAGIDIDDHREHVGDDGGEALGNDDVWAADMDAVDDVDLEPTRRMDVVRSPITEED